MSGGLVERVVKTSHELVVRVSVEGDDDVLGVDLEIEHIPIALPVISSWKSK